MLTLKRLWIVSPWQSDQCVVRDSHDDRPSPRPSSSRTDDSQIISLIEGTTSAYSQFNMEPSLVIRQTDFPIASGGLGNVYKCTWNIGTSPEVVAVKAPRFPSLSDAEVAKINQSLDREIAIWAVLEHQYVLHLHGTVTGFGPFRALVSPWMSNGTLNSYLNRGHAILKTADRLLILRQVVEGLKYLHDNHVIHGDLTSNNVLVAADGSARLADFGISNIMIESNPKFSYHAGAVRWAAPELVIIPEGQIVQCATKSSDIYSFGCIMLQVLYGKIPYWWSKTPLQVVALKFANKDPINTTLQIQAHHLDFMRRCWSIRSENRPLVDEVVNCFL